MEILSAGFEDLIGCVDCIMSCHFVGLLFALLARE